MKRLLTFIICFSILIFWSSCRNDFEFSPSTGNLTFSKDTVYLDTIFTNIGSSTYNLKVYNNSDDDIVIPTIRLANGANSFYRLNVDGTTGLSGDQEGKLFEDIELLAQDSLFIFVETTVDIESLSALNNQFLYTDKILFDAGANEQEVELVTLVKDAVFIYPNRDETTGIIETLSFDLDGDGIDDETTLQGRFLNDDELNFTNEKPYVIYGYAGVDEGQTLSMEAGTRVHFHANSGIIITNNASLQINGAFSTDQDLLENQVILEGDRMEPGFSEVPGQWGTIWLFNGSLNNTINYTTIKNATVGVLAEGNQDASPKVAITNTQIYNSSGFGILGRATSISAENVVVNKSGQASFAATLGGQYNFTHCTLANYWTNSFRQFPTLLINDFVVDDDNNIITNALEEANFNNCIIYGNNSTELLLDQQGEVFNFKFSNCLIRFDNDALEDSGNYIFNDLNRYENVVFNALPNFQDASNNQLQIGNDSAANGIGDPLFSALVPTDILNRDRGSLPDSGAYESITFED